MNFIIWKSQG